MQSCEYETVLHTLQRTMGANGLFATCTIRDLNSFQRASSHCVVSRNSLCTPTALSPDIKHRISCNATLIQRTASDASSTSRVLTAWLHWGPSAAVG